VIHEFLIRISSNNIIVEDSLNAVEEEEKKEEVEKYLTIEHNKDVFNIDFECASRQDNNPITVIPEREDKEKDVGKRMEVSKDEEERIETTFKQWSR